MTLILTVANSSGVYQSSDYQLTTYTGAFVSDKAGSKQIEATFGRVQLQLAFTGIARLGGERTIDWLLTELKVLPVRIELQELCNALKERCSQKIVSKHVRTLVLAVAERGKPFRVLRSQTQPIKLARMYVAWQGM
jgi:hypothetical protein